MEKILMLRGIGGMRKRRRQRMRWLDGIMLGKIEGRRRRDERMRWLDGITDSMDMGSGKELTYSSN